MPDANLVSIVPQQPRLKSSFIYLANAVNDLRGNVGVLALVVGGALGASGAALQGLFRNPLAGPGVTGVTSSAGLGAVIALYFGLAGLSSALVPGFAVLGALAAAMILYLLSRAGAGIMALVLAGVAISSLATALTALALSFAPNPYAMSEMVLWMLGSLKDRTPADLYFAAPLTLLGIALLISAARGLDALTLGEDAAQSLGINVHAVRRRVVTGAALATVPLRWPSISALNSPSPGWGAASPATCARYMRCLSLPKYCMRATISCPG